MNDLRQLRKHKSLGVRAALVWEVVTGGLIELWAHKLRSILTLTLLMLGVFALVVMTSVLDGVKDQVSTGFAGMSWDGTLYLTPRKAKTSEEQKRFAQSSGLRSEDLVRLTAPHPRVLGVPAPPWVLLLAAGLAMLLALFRGRGR